MRAKKHSSILAIVLVAALLASAVAVAQHSARETAARPAPRMPDGKPDLSGIWNKRITANSAVGIELPFTDYGKQRFEAAKNEIDPQARCVFPGVPRIMNLPYPFQIVQLEDKVIFLYEAMHNFRIVYTDGRPLRADLPPALMGHSVGHWDRDTLIVETSGLTDRTWLDDFGNQHSEEMTVVERYERPDYNTLAFDYTITDPKMYTEPWTVPRRLIPLAPPDWELMEYACTDYNRVIDDGLLGPGAQQDGD